MYLDMKVAKSIQREMRRDAAISRVTKKNDLHREHLSQLTKAIAAVAVLMLFV